MQSDYGSLRAPIRAYSLLNSFYSQRDKAVSNTYSFSFEAMPNVYLRCLFIYDDCKSNLAVIWS